MTVHDDAAMPAREPVETSTVDHGRYLSSAAIFRGQREIVIVHHGQEYRLRITKSDKLILTK